MRKLMMVGALIGALVVPAGAMADEPSRSETKNAAKECKALRSAAGSQNFKDMFGGKRNAYGKCVSSRARENSRRSDGARTNAAKECKAEREADPQGFKERYRNLGRCVSERARQNRRESERRERRSDRSERSAARKCKAERRDDPAAFAERYGSRRNAFGKCVSQTARGTNGGGEG